MERIKMVFSTFEDAMDVHKKIFTTLREQGYVSFKDFDKILDIVDWDETICFECAIADYGWYDLHEVQIEQYNSDQWLIIMPEVVKINDKEKEND